jgi:hypothetical protein
MGTKWTPERHEKMQAVWEARRARSAGRVPTQTRSTRRGASPLARDIDKAVEALDLVGRIGWDLARTIAARVAPAA